MIRNCGSFLEIMSLISKIDLTSPLKYRVIHRRMLSKMVENVLKSQNVGFVIEIDQKLSNFVTNHVHFCFIYKFGCSLHLCSS